MKILVISSIPTHPQDYGAKIRIYNLLLSLKSSGNQIHFLYNDMEWLGRGFRTKRINQKADLKKMNLCWDKFYYVSGFSFYQIVFNFIDRSIGQAGIFLKKVFPLAYKKIKPFFHVSILNFSVDRWYRSNLDTFIKKLIKKEKFDMVIVEYVFLSKALDNFDNKVLKVIDTHDVFTNRQKIFEKINMELDWFYTSAEEEAKGLNRADVIMAIQDKEKEFFLKITKKKVITVGHLTTLRKPEWETEGQKGILFVGSGNPYNKQGINFFINEVFPVIQANIPEVKLILAGKISELVGNFDDCTRLGVVNDLELVYNSARVVINPVQMGTGLKIKSIEALGYAKPLVTTSHSAAGLEAGAGKAFLIADTVKDFANSIIKIFSSDELSRELSDNAYNFAKKYNDDNLAKLRKLVS
ncbi:MAG: glycosyl transferase family 1 [Parcubacteria group bacterium]|nr:glycosyl transferase family 1 [Parcubacteria group bacterium]|tara:strand:+ start:6263 stop:7495 length:1233 start_codon:yes stop_codon:yes gene_type:complete